MVAVDALLSGRQGRSMRASRCFYVRVGCGGVDRPRPGRVGRGGGRSVAAPRGRPRMHDARFDRELLHRSDVGCISDGVRIDRLERECNAVSDGDGFGNGVGN